MAWSDAARQASLVVRSVGPTQRGPVAMRRRGGDAGGSLPTSGGGGGLAGRGAQLQRALQVGGSQSRGRWGGGAQLGSSSHVTITGPQPMVAAHQTGVERVTRGGLQTTALPGMYPNVADNAYASGTPRIVSGYGYGNVASNATAKAPGVRHFGIDDI